MFHLQVNFSAFSPSGQILLTASDDGCVYGWETHSSRLLWRLEGHTGGGLCRPAGARGSYLVLEQSPLGTMQSEQLDQELVPSPCQAAQEPTSV